MTVVQLLGANNDWGQGTSPHIDDAVFAYIRNKWTILDPPVTELDDINKAWDNFGQFHLFVQRGEETANRSTLEGSAWFAYITTLRIHLVMQRLEMGMIPKTMQNAAVHVQHMLWMYSPYWIAGIRVFDDFRIVPIDEPDTPANPFRNTWHMIVAVNAYQEKATDFAIDVAPYTPADHPAGQLTYLP